MPTKLFPLILLFSLSSYAQVVSGGGGGGVGIGASNIQANLAGPATTSGGIDITALGLTAPNLNTLIAVCYTGTGYAGSLVTGNLAPLACSITSRSTSAVTVTFASSSNVLVVINSNGGAGPVGPAGAVGPTGAASVVPGPTGATGAAGTDGQPGAQGQTGPSNGFTDNGTTITAAPGRTLVVGTPSPVGTPPAGPYTNSQYGFYENGVKVVPGVGGASGPCSLASSLGFVLNGTDETTLLNSTFAAFYTAGGGCLAIDNGKTLRANGQIALPTTGSPDWAAPAYRITGMGPGVGGSGEGYTPVGGSILDLRYSAGPKLWALGYGSLEIDHITFADMATDCAAFLMTNGARLLIHDTTFRSATVRGTACNDAIILGGTSNYPRAGTITDPFFGYGSVIERNSFINMARVLVMQGNVNDIKFLDNYVFGGNSTTHGPIIESILGGSGNNYSNTIRGNTLEGCTGVSACNISYTCALKLAGAENWTIDSNGWYDSFSGSSYLACGSATAKRNNLLKTNYADSSGGGNNLWDAAFAASNSLPWRSVPFSFDGGGVALTATTRCNVVPFSGQINQLTMMADQIGSATLTVTSVPLASYTGPSSAVGAVTGAQTMSSAITKQAALTVALASNTVLCVALSSPSAITWLSGNLLIQDGK